MSERFIKLQDLLGEGERVSTDYGVVLWAAKLSAFLRAAYGEDYANEFDSLSNANSRSRQSAFQLGHLQGLVATLGKKGKGSDEDKIAGEEKPGGLFSSKVFIVHGHDNESKESTARFLTKLNLHPIILHEQASEGRTIIEKFENYSEDVAFAVVLLTPDDVGGSTSASTDLNPRARQNVILELGYFLGRLGRLRVCALYKGPIELPSDYQGVLYIEMDRSGAWRTKLAQELVQAKLSIDLQAYLKIEQNFSLCKL